MYKIQLLLIVLRIVLLFSHVRSELKVKDRSVFIYRSNRLVHWVRTALFSMSDCIDSCTTRFAAEEDAIKEEEVFCGVGTGVLEADFPGGLLSLLISLPICPM
jgi:hypothetical protein